MDDATVRVRVIRGARTTSKRQSKVKSAGWLGLHCQAEVKLQHGTRWPTTISKMPLAKKEGEKKIKTGVIYRSVWFTT